jgi:hypothetical protein
MNINDFIRKFLPDCKRRYEEYNPARFKSWDVDFIEENFPEALQNFADRICEAQRRKCGEAIMDSNYGYEIRDCENAKQPKIGEL